MLLIRLLKEYCSEKLFGAMGPSASDRMRTTHDRWARRPADKVKQTHATPGNMKCRVVRLHVSYRYTVKESVTREVSAAEMGVSHGRGAVSF